MVTSLRCKVSGNNSKTKIGFYAKMVADNTTRFKPCNWPFIIAQIRNAQIQTRRLQNGMRPIVGFVPTLASCTNARSTQRSQCTNGTSRNNAIPRRSVLAGVVASFVLSNLPSPTTAREWQEEEMCEECSGRGVLNCDFCEGSGQYELGEWITECPNCQGGGTVECAACIGLGLAETNGILRNASRDGRIRMRRDGRYDILQCDAFPACSIYGRGKPSVVVGKLPDTPENS